MVSLLAFLAVLVLLVTVEVLVANRTDEGDEGVLLVVIEVRPLPHEKLLQRIVFDGCCSPLQIVDKKTNATVADCDRFTIMRTFDASSS